MAWNPCNNPATIQKWRERVDAFEGSNLSLGDFSQSIGVVCFTMRSWRRWLAINPPQLPALVEEWVATHADVPPPHPTPPWSSSSRPAFEKEIEPVGQAVRARQPESTTC